MGTPVLLQTTYENFRYRYDKKENPFSKGMLRNVKEIFFGKIPPSMIDFRAWTTEQDQESRHGSVLSEVEKGGFVPKGSFDLDFGGSMGKDRFMKLPSLLRNLDYGEVDEKLKMEGDRDMMYDVDLFPRETDSTVPDRMSSLERQQSNRISQSRSLKDNSHYAMSATPER